LKHDESLLTDGGSCLDFARSFKERKAGGVKQRKAGGIKQRKAGGVRERKARAGCGL
jgi:hypothetical protein